MIFQNADSLYDSAKGEKLTVADVKRVIRNAGHGNVEAVFTELIAELGVRKQYKAQSVLEFLGF